MVPTCISEMQLITTIKLPSNNLVFDGRTQDIAVAS